MRDLVTDAAIRNAMVTHAAFGGSTNLLLHLPAIAHAAGAAPARRRRTGPRSIGRCRGSSTRCRTVRAITRPSQVFLAGAVPEVMLHLRRAGLLDTRALDSERNHARRAARRVGIVRAAASKLRARLKDEYRVDPDDVIMSPDAARGPRADARRSASRTAIWRRKDRVIKSTAIDPRVIDADGVYRQTGRAKVFLTRAGGDRGHQGATGSTPATCSC